MSIQWPFTRLGQQFFELERIADHLERLSPSPSLSDREHATVLAALRYYQQTVDLFEHMTPDIQDIATGGGSFEPLCEAGIDDLCERLNLESAPGKP